MFSPVWKRWFAEYEYSYLKFVNGQGGAPIPLGFCREPLAIIMSYTEGTVLDVMIESPDMTDWMKLQIAANMISKVQEIHDLQIIHNDLKGSNILVNDELDISVIDYGCATFKGQILGYSVVKVKWLDPELQEKGRSSYATDAFSVGFALNTIAKQMVYGAPL